MINLDIGMIPVDFFEGPEKIWFLAEDGTLKNDTPSYNVPFGKVLFGGKSAEIDQDGVYVNPLIYKGQLTFQPTENELGYGAYLLVVGEKEIKFAGGNPVLLAYSEESGNALIYLNYWDAVSVERHDGTKTVIFLEGDQPEKIGLNNWIDRLLRKFGVPPW